MAVLKTMNKTGKRDHLTLDRFLAHLLLHTMQRKATTSASKYSRDDFAERKEELFGGYCGDGRNTPRTNPELRPDRDKDSSLLLVDHERDGFTKSRFK